jgi:hypothetical protein
MHLVTSPTPRHHEHREDTMSYWAYTPTFTRANHLRRLQRRQRSDDAAQRRRGD